jgi:hypothetical protein
MGVSIDRQGHRRKFTQLGIDPSIFLLRSADAFLLETIGGQICVLRGQVLRPVITPWIWTIYLLKKH